MKLVSNEGGFCEKSMEKTKKQGACACFVSGSCNEPNDIARADSICGRR